MARTIVDQVDLPRERGLRMSYDEWHAWFDPEAGHYGEWVDGEVIPFEMPKLIHQALLVLLVRLLADHVEDHDLGQVLVEPMEMWLPHRPAARLPDIFFVAKAHRDRLTENRLEGPADLVVEIVSDDSVTRDRRDKFREYETAGVREYWLLDPRPRRRHAAFYQLAADGRFHEMPLDDRGRYHSRELPGFWLDPSWIWRDPLPTLREIQAEIASEGRRES